MNRYLMKNWMTNYLKSRILIDNLLLNKFLFNWLSNNVWNRKS